MRPGAPLNAFVIRSTAGVLAISLAGTKTKGRLGKETAKRTKKKPLHKKKKKKKKIVINRFMVNASSPYGLATLVPSLLRPYYVSTKRVLCKPGLYMLY